MVSFIKCFWCHDTFQLFNDTFCFWSLCTAPVVDGEWDVAAAPVEGDVAPAGIPPAILEGGVAPQATGWD